MALVERIVTIQNKKGLHARAAAKFVKVAGQFDADIKVIRLVGQDKMSLPEDPDCTVSAKSILGLMMLGAEPGTNLKLQATGLESREAVDSLQQLIEARFDEDE